MTYQISEVNNNRELNQFVDLAWKIYGKDPNWVPPLKLSQKSLLNPKHPFHKTSTLKNWIAKKDREVVGRISACVNNHHNEFHKEKCGFWGFFEVLPGHEAVASELFNTTFSWLKGQGMEIVRGPMNPSTNYECGLLIEGFDDPPQIMMTYNPSSYCQMIEGMGQKKAADLLAWKVPADVKLPEKLINAVRYAEKKASVSYRPLSKKNWDQEVQLMHEIYNDAWENNWGFVPMTKEEFIHTANDLKMVCDEELILFCKVNNEYAGFIIALPDYNQIFKKIPNGQLFPTGLFKILTGRKHIKRARVITLGVKKKYRNLGLSSLLYHKCQENLIKQGFDEVEMSWVLENNTDMNKHLNLMGAIPYKKYRLYESTL